MRTLVVVGLFLMLAGVALEGADGAGECGMASADRVALRLAPCISAADAPQSTPSSSCCSAVHTIGQSPSCLCAVMLSGTARAAGIKPEVAVTIPKRCNMADRPVGYKCGDYTLP
uniref:Bifunctional inhibitor/plant lipid transfer protein/seed storage helical domain-containing protein n=1 Tax=Arundo donax TaxID=35708 RepID=A0A0A9F1X1_ARUDO